jgi:peptidoglycan/LPS O-acetylase OafA/YrhL
MTPERVAALVAQWVRFSTRRLPASIAQRRVEEIDADLKHITHERAHGISDRRIALGVLSRMVRGLAADASWRRRVRARRRHVTKALLAVLVMAIGIAAIVLGEGDSPDLQPLGVLFVLGAVVLVVRAGRRRAG